MGMGISMGIPIPMGWENLFPVGIPIRIPMGILWEYPSESCWNLVGILIGIPQDSYGNGLGMGTEIPLPRQPC